MLFNLICFRFTFFNSGQAKQCLDLLKTFVNNFKNFKCLSLWKSIIRVLRSLYHSDNCCSCLYDYKSISMSKCHSGDCHRLSLCLYLICMSKCHSDNCCKLSLCLYFNQYDQMPFGGLSQAISMFILQSLCPNVIRGIVTGYLYVYTSNVIQVIVASCLYVYTSINMIKCHSGDCHRPSLCLYSNLYVQL